MTGPFLILRNGVRVGLAGDILVALDRMKLAGVGASVWRVKGGAEIARRVEAQAGVAVTLREIRRAEGVAEDARRALVRCGTPVPSSPESGVRLKTSAQGATAVPGPSSVAPPLADQRGTTSGANAADGGAVDLCDPPAWPNGRVDPNRSESTLPPGGGSEEPGTDHFALSGKAMGLRREDAASAPHPEGNTRGYRGGGACAVRDMSRRSELAGGLPEAGTFPEHEDVLVTKRKGSGS